MADHATHEDNVKKIAELIKEIDFGMVTTFDAEGRLHSRPMSCNKKVEFDGDVWFFTYGNSPKVHEIERKPYVNVSFTDPKSNTYVSLSGRAELVRDKAKIAELWEPELKAWFPKGIDEPDIALLKINADQGEFWDAPSRVVAHVISLAKAVTTGKPAHPGENEKVAL